MENRRTLLSFPDICKGCTDRHVGCHSEECKRGYIKAKAEYDEQKKQIDKIRHEKSAAISVLLAGEKRMKNARKSNVSVFQCSKK